MADLIAETGRGSIAALSTAVRVGWLPVRVLARLVRRPREGGRAVYDETLRQLAFTGVEGLDVTALIGAAVGAAITAQTLALFTGADGQHILAVVLRLIIVRELAPVLTAVIVIVRSGSSVTVDLGNASLRGELDALRAMGIDPIRYLATTRLVGVVLSTICLGLAFDVFALIGGFFAARLLVATPIEIVADLVRVALEPADVLVSVGKTALFGGIIAAVATHEGLSVRGSALELPRATRRSVVYALVACLLVDAAVTLLTWRGMGG